MTSRTRRMTGQWPTRLAASSSIFLLTFTEIECSDLRVRDFIVSVGWLNDPSSGLDG